MQIPGCSGIVCSSQKSAMGDRRKTSVARANNDAWKEDEEDEKEEEEEEAVCTSDTPAAGMFNAFADARNASGSILTST